MRFGARGGGCERGTSSRSHPVAFGISRGATMNISHEQEKITSTLRKFSGAPRNQERG